MVVGDGHQSIVPVARKVDIKNILAFEKDYEEAVVVARAKLPPSTGHIVAATMQLLQHNSHRKPKLGLFLPDERRCENQVYQASDSVMCVIDSEIETAW